jgi:hypothetical protein
MTQPGGVMTELDGHVGMMVAMRGHRPYARRRSAGARSLAGAGGAGGELAEWRGNARKRRSGRTGEKESAWCEARN